VALAIAGFVEAKAGSRPVVYMGDLNAHLGAAPSGPAAHLVARGYYDASATLKRSNIRYSTVNHTGQIDNLKAPGYPYTPYKRKYAASRIDYILTKNAPGAWRYANQVVLTPEGKFDSRYQGSDHNLQWADIGIPAG
jgi:hypothetical protein